MIANFLMNFHIFSCLGYRSFRSITSTYQFRHQPQKLTFFLPNRNSFFALVKRVREHILHTTFRFSFEVTTWRRLSQHIFYWNLFSSTPQLHLKNIFVLLLYVRRVSVDTKSLLRSNRADWRSYQYVAIQKWIFCHNLSCFMIPKAIVRVVPCSVSKPRHTLQLEDYRKSWSLLFNLKIFKREWTQFVELSMGFA